MKRPRGAPDPLYHHYLVVAEVATALMLIAVPLVIVLGHLDVYWPVIAAALGAAGGALVVAVVLPWSHLERHRGGQAILYGWSLVDLGAIGAGVAASGGARSWLWVLFFLPTIFFSVGYPLAGQLFLLGATLTTFVAASWVGSDVDAASLAWKTAVLVSVFVLASFPGWELRRQSEEQRRARQDADSLASQLAYREQWWRSLIERASDPVVVFSNDRRVAFASPALETLLGRPATELAAAGLPSLMHPDDLGPIDRAFERTLAGRSPTRLTCRLRRVDGSWCVVEISLAQTYVGTSSWVVTNLHDVTERVVAQAALAHRATHDSLTDLANRTAFYDSLRQALSAPGGSVGVLVFDLERFKDVNAQFGHLVGDQLIVEAGRRLVAALPHGTVVARLGGDEFGAVLKGATRARSVAQARQALDALAEPIVVGGRPFWLRASAGTSVFPSDGDGAEELLQQALGALQEAKRLGCGVAAYTPEMEPAGASSVGLLGELRQALADGNLRLLFQPKVSLGTGEVLGAEALVRWPHPRLGLLQPAAFLPEAEASGLVRLLTAWVVPRALDQLAAWRRRGLDLAVAVNLSAQDLCDATLVDDVLGWLENVHVPPSCLVLELTESSAIGDHERGAGVLAELRTQGVQISLDDFGSGYSSLAYLAELPLDEVKLDRRFLVQADSFLLRSVIGIGHHLGLRVVAEGVETPEARRQLVALGADAVQGNVCAEPLAPEAFLSFVKHWRPRFFVAGRRQKVVALGA